jgi:hypothetical protein
VGFVARGNQQRHRVTDRGWVVGRAAQQSLVHQLMDRTDAGDC